MKKTINDIYRLKIRDAARAAQVLFLALKDDPKLRSMFPDESSVKKEMPTLIEFLVNYNIRCGVGYATSKELEGIALWQDTFTGFDPLQAMRSGFFNLIRVLSWRSISRLFMSYRKITKYQKRVFPKRYMGLELLGVDPNHQKQGYAGMLLRFMLSDLDVKRLPCCLMTNTETNIEIYEKYAFNKVGVCIDEEANVRSYYMTRAPQGNP